MRLFFLGSGAFGLPTLQRLASSPAHSLAGICTQPDRPAGRGRTLTPTPIGAWASTHLPTTPLIKAESVNDLAITDRLRRDFGPGGTSGVDAWVVIAFGQKLSAPLLSRVRAINLHASLLPRWRGAAPINAAMLAGDPITGNSVITLAQRMDAGLILGQSTRTIEPQLTAGELHDLLAADGPDLVVRTLAAIASGAASGTPQDESLATKAPKLSRADACLDFTAPAAVCRQRTHALTPWPGITVRIGSLDVKLLRVAAHEPDASTPTSTPAPPGTLLDPQTGTVACGPAAAAQPPTRLRLLEVQPPGSRPMPWSAFVSGSGRGLVAGDRVQSGSSS